MAYEPLHHKYRPQTLAELTGQEAIAQTLTNALNSSKIAPAYLFSGPRGTGKTSSARILAKSLNCLSSDHPTHTPCGQCEICVSITNGSALDVIEIDAASNTGVDNIREIIERAQFAPVKCRYKVYVIDECHMLSTAAFNALLKTLEEPPPRVIFVLATTDPQRVLPTILSRCQRFDYRRIPIDSMTKHLRYIADQENINIEDDALSLISQLSNGGMRDAESLLDQLSLISGTITAEKVWDLVGAVSEEDLLELLEAIATDSAETVITQCRKLLDRGREPVIVLQNLANFYLNLLIAKTSPQRKDLVPVTEATWQKLGEISPGWQTNVILQGQKKLKDSEVQIRNSTQPRLWLEITLLSLLPSANQTTIITQTPINQSQTNITTTIETHQKLSSSTASSPSQPAPLSSTNFNTSISESSSHNQFNNLQELQELVSQNCQQATKAFLTQHCQLVNFDNKTAIIFIRKSSLLKMAKSFQAELESVFSQIIHQPIKVLFHSDNQTNSSNSSSSLPNRETPNNNPLADLNQVNNAQEKNDYSPTNNNQKNLSSSPSIKDQSPLKTSTSSHKEKDKTDNPKSISASNTTASNSSKTTKNAIESLTKSLNGEIIFTESQPESIVKITKVTNRPPIDNLSDDDGDIPF